jgi:hypothetical protein
MSCAFSAGLLVVVLQAGYEFSITGRSEDAEEEIRFGVDFETCEGFAEELARVDVAAGVAFGLQIELSQLRVS